MSIGWNPAPPEPDIVVHHHQSGDHLVMECKASGFGSESSTAGQARKLLVAGADAEAALSISGDAFILYTLPSEDADLQMQCLEEICVEVEAAGFETAPYGTLGLEIDESGLWADLRLSRPCDKPHLLAILGRVLVSPAVGGDSRPLYLIPYDPTTAENQDPDEKAYCYRQLLERFYLAAVRALGTARVPDSVVLMGDDLLREATFGISPKWHAKELNKLKGDLLRGMTTVLGKKNLKGKVHYHSSQVEVILNDDAERQAAINMLLKANSEQLALKGVSGQLDIEDGIDESSSVSEV
ncbi:hypothetical protein [Streptomyces sp. NPDC002250]|uniref:hypothetical protein n=1 Tax=Streptomyces sp. NPDC002250 TaxID=3364641 RepID=UPI0036B67404